MEGTLSEFSFLFVYCVSILDTFEEGRGRNTDGGGQWSRVRLRATASTDGMLSLIKADN